MPLSNSPLAYSDVQKILDLAVASERGVKTTLPSYGKAVNFRQRAYKLRQIVREQSLKDFPFGDPRHGTSPYDILIFDVPKNTNVFFAHKSNGDSLEIEEL